MSESTEIETGVVHVGDCIDVLKEMPAKSVHCVICSPPYYGLRDYGRDGQLGMEKTLDGYIENITAVGEEIDRVLRDDGVWWLNLGDTYAGGGGAAGKPDDYDDLHADEEYPDKPPARNTSFPDKSKMLVPYRVAIGLQEDGWILRNDATWCLAASTKVYARTQKREGPMMLKDIARLNPDTVELWNGEKWTQVIDFYKNRAPESACRLRLRNGERIDCTEEHKWVTQNGEKTTQELEVGDVLCETELPEPEEGDMKTPDYLPDEEIGWLVGLYIAEGSRGKSGEQIQIAGHVDEVERYERVSEIADNLGATCKTYNTKGNAATINLHGEVVNGVLDQYVRGSDAQSKRLRPRAWMRSDAFLDSVLQGYLHGDGSYDEKNDRWRLGFTRNDELANDIRTICARLGYNIRLQRAEVDGYKMYRGEIRYERSQNSKKHDTEITEISNSPCRTFYDVEVADDPHLFALASGVLTHNSKPNPMPHPAKDRLNTTTERFFLLAKEQQYWFDLDAIREPHAEVSKKRIDHGWRLNYPDDSGLGFDKTDIDKMGNRFAHPAGKNPGDVFEVPTQPFGDAHFAVYPLELLEKPMQSSCPPKVCADCGTPYERDKTEPEQEYERGNEEWRAEANISNPQRDHDGNWEYEAEFHGWKQMCECATDETEPGIVLDPFIGAGTTAISAEKHDRRWIGIDLNEEYAEMTEERVANARKNPEDENITDKDAKRNIKQQSDKPDWWG